MGRNYTFFVAGGPVKIQQDIITSLFFYSNLIMGIGGFNQRILYMKTWV